MNKKDKNILLGLGIFLSLVIGGYLAYTWFWPSNESFSEEGLSFEFPGSLHCTPVKPEGEEKPDTWYIKSGKETKMAICTLERGDLPQKQTPADVIKFLGNKFPPLMKHLATYEPIDPSKAKLELISFKDESDKEEGKKEDALHYISLPVTSSKDGGINIECYCLESENGYILMLFLDKRKKLDVPTKAFEDTKELFISSVQTAIEMNDISPALFNILEESLKFDT